MAVSALLAGCSGPPQAAPHNLGLISALRTAVSARNAEWLEDNARAVEERYSQGELSPAEHETFRKILALAREGEWEEAERAVVAFQKAQRPAGSRIGAKRSAKGDATWRTGKGGAVRPAN